MNNNNIIRILGAAVLFVALLVISGWSLDIGFLISVTPNMTAMNPVTAIAFMLSSVWVLIRVRGRKAQTWKTIEVFIGALVFTIGFVKLLEYANALPTHIDRLLFQTSLSTRMQHNAMAPTTAQLFVFTGIILLSSYSKGKIHKIITDTLLLVSFLIAYMGIIGYIYSLEPFYRIGPFVPMALNTACCFIMLVIALFLLFPKGYLSRVLFSRNIGGTLVRRAIPIILLIPPAFGYLRLFLHRAQFYNVEYSIVLDTAFIVLLVLLLIFYYAGVLNKKDYERRIAERVLTQSEEKYRSLVFALKEGIIYYNLDRKIIFCNPSFASMMGYTEEELIGKDMIDTLTPEENRERARQRMQKRLSGMTEDYEAPLLHRDGSNILAYITSRPIIKDGEINSFLSTVTDITERKKREEDIEAFSASAAHDLNAPLAQIEMVSNYIMEYSKGRLSDEDIEMLGLMIKTAVDMRALLKDLLTFSKAGAEKINKVPVDMNKIVSEILTTFPHPGTKVSSEDLSEGLGDPASLKQVWTNLILNAIKYSSKKEEPEVHIGVFYQNEKSVYYVKDNGAGFDMNESWKLFAPFKRLHSEFEGNGLGLPIVKRIVEKHGGRVWAEGNPGVGATFYFFI